GTNNATLAVSFSDPGTDTFTVNIDWGDGSAHTTGSIVSGQTFTHTYGTGGPFTAKVIVSDDDTGSSPLTNSSNTISVGYQSVMGILQPINYTGPRSLFKY